MQHYQFHFFDRLNVRFLVRTWSGTDDIDALDKAQELSATHTIEVWQGGRRVACVNRADSPLRTRRVVAKI